MQVIMPMQQEDWMKMKSIASTWVDSAESDADAWYFLGLAHFQMDDYAQATSSLQKSFSLNNRHLDSLMQLYEIAKVENDSELSEWTVSNMRKIDHEYVEYILKP